MNLKSTIIRSAGPDDISEIAQFNIAMAQETEERPLDSEIIRSGVAGIIQDHARGFYLIAERGQATVGSLLITFEWSDWRNGTLWWIQSIGYWSGWSPTRRRLFYRREGHNCGPWETTDKKDGRK